MPTMAPFGAAVRAMPPNERLELSQVISRIEHPIITPTPPRERTAYTAVSLFCIFCLAFILGFRSKRVGRFKPNFAQVLVYIQTILGVCFVLSSSVIVVGLSFTTHAQCYAAVVICLIFYTSCKMTLYMFLLERAHIVRAPFIHQRVNDMIWVCGMAFIVIAFGALSIWCYATPHAEISAQDGRCRIGKSAIASYLLLTFDAFMDAILTIIFVLLLRPVLNFQLHNATKSELSGDAPPLNWLRRSIVKIGWSGKRGEETRQEYFRTSIKALLRKNVVGSSLIFLGSAANLTAFYIYEATQLGFLCLITCMADVTFGILIVHWLTLGSEAEARYLSRASTTAHSSQKSSNHSSRYGSLTKPKDAPPRS